MLLLIEMSFSGAVINCLCTLHHKNKLEINDTCESFHVNRSRTRAGTVSDIIKRLPHLQMSPKGTKIINNLQFTAAPLIRDDFCIPYLSMIFVTRDAHMWAFMEHPKHDSVMGNQVENHCTNLHLSGAGELW